MITCQLCKKRIAVKRGPEAHVLAQRGAYIRHLKGAHEFDHEPAKALAQNVPIEVSVLDSLSFEQRWMKARLMWAENKKVADIAAEYDVTSKAMGTRIRRWRKEHGWFPPRTLRESIRDAVCSD
jgi:hypothetical protein